MDDEDNVAVAPLNDKRKHELFDDQCECQPDTEIIGDVLLLVHNSFDFREIAEILNDQKDQL